MDLTAIPIELVHDILEVAAGGFVTKWRSWALQLALLNHSISRSLRPILFHSIIIDRRNASYFATAGPSDVALSFARHISIIPGVDGDVGAAILARWKPAIGSFLYAEWQILREFMDSPESEALRGVEVRYERLLSAFTERPNPAPVNVTRQLTRVAGFLPLYWSLDGDEGPAISTKSWATLLSDKLPALVNLGLDLFQIDQSWTIDATEQAADTLTPPEQYLRTVRDVLLTLLEIKPQLRICLRVFGRFIKLRSSIQRIIVGGVTDSRLRVIFDLRPTEDIDAVDELRVQDAWEGRDIWTVIPRSELEAGSNIHFS